MGLLLDHYAFGIMLIYFVNNFKGKVGVVFRSSKWNYKNVEEVNICQALMIGWQHLFITLFYRIVTNNPKTVEIILKCSKISSNVKDPRIQLLHGYLCFCYVTIEKFKNSIEVLKVEEEIINDIFNKLGDGVISSFQKILYSYYGCSCLTV